MGSDLTVVDAARVSFNKRSHLNEHGQLLEKDKKLINYLAKHGHWTPFAHPQLSVRVTVPIFIANQLKRHQVGLAVNEVSRRYVDDEPEFYVPDKWRSRPEGSVKQGSGDNEVTILWKEAYEKNLVRIKREKSREYTSDLIEDMTKHYTPKKQYEMLINNVKSLYNEMIKTGVAPEMARMVLPMSTYTSWIWTGSLAAFIRICKQRIDSHAQYEVQLIGKQLKDILIPLFPVSCEAYGLL